MNKARIALAGLGAGMGVMYFADPQEGRRRRARLRDLVVHTAHTLQDAAGVASRDMDNRLVGLAARTAAALAAAPAPSDEVLAARVRTRLGRLVSHPSALDVTASAGRVTLSGPVFEAEVRQLIEGVRAVPGVAGVDTRLEPHAEAGDIPALQGPGPLHVHAAPEAWIRWTPTTRAMAGAAGLALIVLASRRRSVRETAVGLAGFELLEEAVRGARAAA
ncbi:MAG: BON domain-containing protein [Betaproteobacteria bacterium]